MRNIPGPILKSICPTTISSTYTIQPAMPVPGGIARPMKAGISAVKPTIKLTSKMKRTKQTRPAPECPDYTHILPKKLADTLHQKTGERYSKFEAFRYLMERQAKQDPDGPGNHAGTFEVTITELSLDWGWHRHTVTAFLQKLARMGYLSVEKTTSSFRLRLPELFVKDRVNA